MYFDFESSKTSIKVLLSLTCNLFCKTLIFEQNYLNFKNLFECILKL
jgi:hypothetical protein